ncbi:MAG: extensin family protein, partial [Proteobacteria bacterium]|nr:extensin family protein [Pseudomonadota bacterium]
TARGHADVLADWGMTERDVKSKIAAAEAAARAQARAKSEAEAKALAAAPTKPAAVLSQGTSATITGSTIRSIVPRAEQGAITPAVDGFAALRGMVPDVILGLGPTHDAARGLSLDQQPSRLGGPKVKDGTGSVMVEPSRNPTPVLPPGAQNIRQAFLKQLHDSACRRFGTVLGPEANEAHRNHFHLDMAERGVRGSFCE